MKHINDEVSDEKIYLDREGYNKYLKLLEELKDRLMHNSKEKSESYASAVGDGWHDNFAFEQAKRDEYKLMAEIKRRTEDLRKIVIVEKSHNSKLVDIGDYVLLSMDYGDGDIEEDIFRVVASDLPNFDADVQEVTINSPLGKKIYQKPVGSKDKYTVQKSIISLEIIKIAKTLEELKENKLRR